MSKIEENYEAEAQTEEEAPHGVVFDEQFNIERVFSEPIQPNDDEIDQTISQKSSLFSLEERIARFKSLDDLSIRQQDSDTDLIFQQDYSLSNQFFTTLGNVPSISEVTLDVEEIKSESDAASIPPTEPPTSIVFVGQDAIDDFQEHEESAEQVEDKDAIEAAEIVEEEEHSSSIAEDDELLQLLDQKSDTDVILDKELEEANAVMATFLDMGEQEAIQLSEIDFEALAREENERQMHLHVQEFLNKLIQYVVHTCEYVDPNSLIRVNVDKTILMNELIEKKQMLEVERTVNSFLNKSIVRYYNKKNITWPFIKEDSTRLASLKMKFMKARKNLDIVLEKEIEVKREADISFNEMLEKLSNQEVETQNAVANMEETIRKAYERTKHTNVKLLVDKHLNMMRNKREEISSVRLVLITRLHTLANLKKKLQRLEYIGEGLSMKNFENLRNETQKIEKKIEEKASDVSKLHHRYCACLHVQAQYQEKIAMIKSVLEYQKEHLFFLLYEKEQYRNFMNDMKKEHLLTRHEIAEVSFQGILIDKLDLLHDYDEVCDAISQKYKINKELKKELAKTTAKCEQLEAKYGLSDKLYPKK